MASAQPPKRAYEHYEKDLNGAEQSSKDALIPVNWVYNYVGETGNRIEPELGFINRMMKSSGFLPDHERGPHAISFNPVSQGVIQLSGLTFCRQNRHTDGIFKFADTLWKAFAEDESATYGGEMGKSFAAIAKTQLPSTGDGWLKFGALMWPEAPRRQAELLGAMLIYMLVFDGKPNRLRDSKA
jgi:hypothetical protein